MSNGIIFFGSWAKVPCLPEMKLAVVLLLSLSAMANGRYIGSDARQHFPGPAMGDPNDYFFIPCKIVANGTTSCKGASGTDCRDRTTLIVSWNQNGFLQLLKSTGFNFIRVTRVNNYSKSHKIPDFSFNVCSREIEAKKLHLRHHWQQENFHSTSLRSIRIP